MAGHGADSWHDMEHVGGQHLVEQLHDADDRQRRHLARLDHDRVAHGEGGRDLAAGVNRGPVERDDRSDHAERLEDSSGVVAVSRVVEVAGKLVDDATEEPEHADQKVDVEHARVGQRLAVLERLDLGDLVRVRFEDVRAGQE